MLLEDEEVRRDGTGSEELFQDINGQLCEAGVAASSPFRSGAKPQYGLSDREVQKVGETVDDVLPSANAALARGDISFVEEELGELLDLFRINLDRSSAAYRRLGMQVLRRWVQALQATEKRHKGEVVETPEIIEPTHDEPATAGTLSAALDGWKKAKQPTPTTGNEFDHAVRRFTELHGDLPVADVTRRHVREFREALQAIPVRRAGALLKANLPQLVEWATKHPEAEKVSAATVNKLLGGVQAVAVWGRDNGLVP